jgi:hypothetical protein
VGIEVRHFLKGIVGSILNTPHQPRRRPNITFKYLIN